MARTQGELLDELTKRVDAITLALEGVRTISTVEITHIKDGLREAQSFLKELQLADSKLAERIAALEQRCAALEKQSDRGFNFGQAAIISGISMIGGALLSLLVQLAIKK
jgi:hypothetical protein